MKSTLVALSVVLFVLIGSARARANSTSSAPAPRAAATTKHISVLRVVTADWVTDQYGAFSWEHSVWPPEVAGAFRTGSSATFQWFEATIWPEQHAVHLYKFNQTFDTSFGRSREQWIAHRESYRIAKADIPAGANAAQKSQVLRDAFKMFYTLMVSDTPAQHYGIRYSGHGSGNAGLFQQQISGADARDLLDFVTGLIGKRLDFIDFGGNCNEGTALVMASFHRYFDYMLASDLPIGGYTLDQWTVERFLQNNPDSFFPLVLTPDRTVRDALTEYLTRIRQRWENSRGDMIAQRTKQNLSLFKMDALAPLAQALSAQLRPPLATHDVYTLIRTAGRTDLDNLFMAFRIEYRSNKDFFTWDADSNGLYIEQASDLDVASSGSAPGPPSALTASTTGSTATLMWIAPTTGGVHTSYIIEAGSSPDAADLAALSTGGIATTYTATSIGPGRYFVRVKASNAAGASASSNELTLVFGAGCSAAPGAPAGLHLLSNSQGAVSVAWSSASGSPSTYVLEAGSTFGSSDLASVDVGADATVFATTGVPRGSYYLRVRARSACGVSGPSNEIVVVVI